MTVPMARTCPSAVQMLDAGFTVLCQGRGLAESMA